MKQQIYNLGGLDLRSNPLVKPDNKCTDCRNVDLSVDGVLKKREGSSFVKVTDGTDLVFYSTSSKMLSYNGGLFDLTLNKAVPINGSYVPAVGTTVDYVEYNDILYFIDNDGTHPLMKYDGYNVTKAGVGNTGLSLVTTGIVTGVPILTGYIRLVAYLVDIRGNIVFSNYTSLTYTTDTTFDLYWDNTVGGTGNFTFFNKYSRVTEVTTITYTKLNNVINCVTTNYVVGDFIRALDTNGNNHILEIIALNSGQVTLNIPDGIGVSYANGDPIEQRAFVRIFTSQYQDYGYYTRDDNVFNLVMNNKDSSSTAAVFSEFRGQIPRLLGTSSQDIPMEEIYDTSIARDLPPICKHLALYNESLVLGNRTSKDVVYNQKSSTLNESIYWSSIQLLQGGTSVENFPPNNTLNVGNTFDGTITGLVGTSNALVIGKDRQIYYLNGVFQDNSFRVWSSLSEKIGIASSRSIVTFAGNVMFMSIAGVYGSNGGSSLIEVSDKIQNLFSSGVYDLTKTVSAIDPISERVLFYLKGISPTTDAILVYNYFYKEWFLWDMVGGDRGLSVDLNGNFYTATASKLFASGYVSKLNNAISYDEVPGDINGTTTTKSNFVSSYSTNWFNFGMPSIKKKLTKFTAISTGAKDYNLTIKEQINWNNTDELTIVDVPLGPLNRSNDRKLLANKAFSFRVILSDDGQGGDFNLSGIELDYVNDLTSKGTQ